MKTRILILAVLTVICTFNIAAVHREITLDGTKSISELLDVSLSSVTSLKISGPIKSKDFITLSRMVTYLSDPNEKNPTRGNLKSLDLTDAELIGDEYMDANCFDFSNEYFSTNFYRAGSLDDLILPKSTIKLGNIVKLFIIIGNITIPKDINTLDSIKKIESLKSITVDKDNPYFEDHNGIVYTKGGEELLFMPIYNSTQTIYEGTKIIGENSMICSYYNTKSLEIPASVKIFRHDAMSYCNIISLPDGVTEIGRNAFRDCYFKILNIPKSITKITPKSFNDIYCDSIIFHDGVKEICDSAFYWSRVKSGSVIYITLPSQIEKIGDYSFSNYIDGSTHDKRIIKIPSTLKEFGCGNISLDDEIYLWSKDPKLLDFSHSGKDLFLDNKVVLYVPADSFDDFYNYQMEDGTFPYRLLKILRKFNPGVYPQFYYASVDGVDADAVTVTVNNGVLSVANGKDGDEIKVYSVAGALMSSGTVTGNATQISLPAKGAYVVTVGNKTYKVMN